MTISTTIRTAGPFTGNGITSSFPFSFKVFARSDLLVATTVTATGVETILTLDADYVVNLNNDQNANPGGVITTTVPVPVGSTLATTSNIPIAQNMDLTNQGGFYPKVINDALDRVVIQIQQLAARVGLGALNIGSAATLASVLNFVSVLASSVGASLVGFIQAGAGSVARTLLDKLLDGPVSITDKGGKTSLADNSAALLAALNTGRPVYIPDGIWKLTTSVELPSGARVFGPGRLYRTNAGPIFTATSKADIKIDDLVFQGDVNSWALMLNGCKIVMVSGTHCTNIMLVQTNSTPQDYTPTTDANMSDDINIIGNTGDCQLVPNAVSQQFIRILYTRNFTVANNSAFGYRDLILAWGGDFVQFGAVANLRKCYKGLIEGNRGTVLAAGIWTAMASDILIKGNHVVGLPGNAAEGLDSEGSDNITFEGNHAHGFAVGCSIFGINRNTVFKNNDVSASSFAFRNANSTFYAGYGQVTFDGNIFSGTVAACVGGTIGSAGRVVFTHNICQNVAFVMSDASIAELIFYGNRCHYDYAPSALWLLRVGSLAIGYSDQPKRPRIIIRDNLFEWRSSGILSKRVIGLTASTVDHTIEISNNTFTGIDEQVSYEGTSAGMYVLVKNNIFDANATYPCVLHAASTNIQAIWQDNSSSLGLDAYGSNTAPALSAGFFSDSSRIWNNTPTNGGTPFWVRRTGVWGPAAANG